MKIYLVGGAVRDKLLGLPVKDRDWVVVGATAEEMYAHGYKKVGLAFPVFLHPKTHEEYALARTERKIGPGYQGFEFHADPSVTLEEDLSRRDLTINAIARSRNGRLVDPFHGERDLKHRHLRHVSAAFIEDPVRILRVARFAAKLAAYNFQVVSETNRLMREMVLNGEINALVPERVWQECEKALATHQPSYFFKVLRHCGALAVLFPEIDRLFGVPASPEWHPEIDTGVHVMMALDAAAQMGFDSEVQFAVLMHDLGKGLTDKQHWPSHTGHDESGLALVKAFCDRWHVPNTYRDLAMLVTRYHGICHKVISLRADAVVTTLQALDAFRKPARFQQFLQACQADSCGRIGHENDPYPQARIFQQAYELAARVSPQPFIDAGYQGMEIARQLYAARVKAVKVLL